MSETAQQTAMIVPSHGRGKLLPGGKIGNKGGGVPPSEVRRKCREDFDKARPWLAKMASGKQKDGEIECPNCETVIPVAKNMERIRAAEVLGKYAGIEKPNVVTKAHPKVLARLDATWDWLQHTPLISEEHREQAIKEMDAIWGGK